MQINPCLTYATVCSGIECMSAACADLPMRPVFFSEIEPFPCAVLKSHFPNVPNLGDMSKITVTNEGKEISNGSVRIVLDERLDIFAGGTPCQDVSVAGKRSGMQEGSGTRSSLAFEFVRLVRELKPRYVLWENVAGVLSDKSFPKFLAALANCGYGVAYRTLDAQWVRVADCYHEDGGVVRMERAIPQRRRRVWVVGCAGGDVAKASQILFEHKSVAGDYAPRRRTGQEISAALRGRNRLHGGMVGEAPRTTGEGIVSYDDQMWCKCQTDNVLDCMKSSQYKDPQCIALDGDKLKPRTDQRKGGNGFGINEDGAGYTLTGVDRHGVAYGVDSQGGAVPSSQKEFAGTICAASNSSGNNLQGVAYRSECYENHAQDSRVREITVSPTIPQKAGTGGNNLPLVVFNKVSHPHGKDGEGERWDYGEVASTRNVFDISETRSQECVVHSTNSNGGDVMPTLTNDLAKQTGNQQAVGGGGVHYP